MSVNANSVITTTLNSYWPAVYTALTDMEDYCYTSSTRPATTTGSTPVAGLAQYQPFFSSLNSAIVSWMSQDCSSALAEYIRDLYGYIVIGNNYGSSTGLLSAADGYSRLGANGYFASLLTRSISYYDDYVAGSTTGTTGTATNLTSDTSLVSSAFATDISNMQSYGASMRGGNDVLFNKLLFESVPFTNPALTQQQLGNEVFVTMHFREVFKYLNVGALTLPSYII